MLNINCYFILLMMSCVHGLNLYDKGCSDSTDCPGVAVCLTAGCLGTQCLCPENYMPSDDYTKCLRVVELGEACDDPGTRCRLPNTRCSQGKCECQAGFIRAVDNKRCKRQSLSINSGWALLGEACDDKILCSEGHTMVCDGVCKCAQNFRDATPSDLSAFPFNGECISSSYILGDDITRYKDNCLSVPEGGIKDIGAQCFADTNCPGNATCQQVGCDKKCFCEVGFAPSSDRKNCLKLSSLDKACSSETVCETLYSRCSDEGSGSVCKCDYGYEAVNNLCRKISNFPNHVQYANINETCGTSGSIPIKCQSDLECISTKCQCDPSFLREATVLERIAFNPEGYCVAKEATLNPTEANKDEICAQPSSQQIQPSQSSSVNQPLQSSFVDLAIQSSSVNEAIQSSSVDQEIQSLSVDQAIHSASVNEAIHSASVNEAIQSASVNEAIQSSSANEATQSSPVDQAMQSSSLPISQQLQMETTSTVNTPVLTSSSFASEPVPMLSTDQPEPSWSASSESTILPRLQLSSDMLSLQLEATESIPFDTQIPIGSGTIAIMLESSNIQIGNTEIPEINGSSIPMPEESEVLMLSDTNIPMPESSNAIITSTEAALMESSEISVTETQATVIQPTTALPSGTQTLEASVSQSGIVLSATATHSSIQLATQIGVDPYQTSTPALESSNHLFVESSLSVESAAHQTSSLAGIVPSMSSQELSSSEIIQATQMQAVVTSSTFDTTTSATYTTTTMAKAGIYNSCFNDTICPDNAECREFSCSGKRCFCKDGYFPAKKDTECLKGVNLGETCNDTITCTVPFSLCHNGKCVCGQPFVRETPDGFCSSDLPSVGENCMSTTQCHGMASCNVSTSRCVCDEGYREATKEEVFAAGSLWYINGRCTQLVNQAANSQCAKQNVGDGCQGDVNCPNNSRCISSVSDGSECSDLSRCWCDIGFAPSVDMTSCLPVINLNQTCHPDKNRCITPLSRCIDGVCQCLRGFQPAANNTVCKPDDYPEFGISTPILGQQCDNDTKRCVMKGEQQCNPTTNVCECRTGLREATYLDKIALYYDMRQCRNASTSPGYRPILRCSDPPVPLVANPDFDIPNIDQSDLSRNQLLLYILAPLVVVVAAVAAVMYTVMKRRRRQAIRDNDSSSSITSETDSVASFHLPRPHFNMSKFREDKHWIKPQIEFDNPTSRTHN